MSLFNFNIEELLTFFAVLVRYSVLFAILPFVGDRFVPSPVKVLLAWVVAVALFPALVASDTIHILEARLWGSTAWGIASTIGLEVFLGLALGFTAKIAFDAIAFGANLVGNFMGFASASIYDPHQESQTEVIAQIQTSLAFLVFLTLDGHHTMLRATLDSYRIVGLGRASLSSLLSQKLIQITNEIFQFGLQIAAPVAISLFAVNIAFGIMSKAMPQLNILVLSFSVSALIGFVVLFLSMPEFQSTVGSIFERMYPWLTSVLMSLADHRR